MARKNQAQNLDNKQLASGETPELEQPIGDQTSDTPAEDTTAGESNDVAIGDPADDDEA